MTILNRATSRLKKRTQNLYINNSNNTLSQENEIKRIIKDIDNNRQEKMHNVPTEDGGLICILTEAINAKNVVEIGTSNGYSGLWICLALQRTGGRLTTYESNQQQISLARENFKQAGVDNMVTIIEGNAHKKTVNQKGTIDILFIDADKEGYLDYFNKLSPLVRPGGLILAHNMDMRQRVQNYIEAVTNNPTLETTFQGQNQGLGITLKKPISK
jgi:caffeoyl-CoA O-methyltransferase